MRWTYDLDVPVLTLRLADGPSARQRELDDGCILDFSESGEIICVEIISPAEAAIDLEALQREGLPEEAVNVLRRLTEASFPRVHRDSTADCNSTQTGQGESEVIDLVRA